MVKSKHKLLSILMCLVLAVTAVSAGTIQAFASSGDTVYVKANNGWTNLYCYMWTDGSGNNAQWPGVKMTKVEDNVYSYQLSGDFKNVIFNNGSGGNGNQTADLTYAGDGKIYDLSANSWSDYSGAETKPTSPQPTTPQPTTPQPTQAPGDGTTVYLNNEAGWTNPYVYMWTDGEGNNAQWPGVKMTSLGNNEWTYTASKEFKNCIFNSGSTKTGDLTAKDGYIYNNKTNEWSIYDTSPIKVTGFTTSPSSGVYVGSEVTLSASATSSESTAVFYRFAVTKSGSGETVVQNYNTNSKVIWTPKSAGSYTVSFGFKDNAGNENERTTTVTVADDSALSSPVIKAVTPRNQDELKANTSSTITVNAGGGKTGTNLLFYKYVVTDPNGKKNTPYYTLNKTYKFTPTVLGKYTVDVSVQASDNSTVTSTYEYEVKDDVVVPTTGSEPTQPTTQAPKPTQPTQPTTQTQPTQPSTEHVEKIKGDANADGRVSIQDASYIQKLIAGYKGYERIDLETMDMDDNGVVNIIDATLIQKMLIGN